MGIALMSILDVDNADESASGFAFSFFTGDAAFSVGSADVVLAGIFLISL
jgi:hypothetical protein